MLLRVAMRADWSHYAVVGGGVEGICNGAKEVGHARTAELRKERTPNFLTMALKKVLQRVKFGRLSSTVIGARSMTTQGVVATAKRSK
jgi:hypothetical protein